MDLFEELRREYEFGLARRSLGRRWLSAMRIPGRAPPGRPEEGPNMLPN